MSMAESSVTGGELVDGRSSAREWAWQSMWRPTGFSSRQSMSNFFSALEYPLLVPVALDSIHVPLILEQVYEPIALIVFGH
jgi:hypothetical protein